MNHIVGRFKYLILIKRPEMTYPYGYLHSRVIFSSFDKKLKPPDGFLSTLLTFTAQLEVYAEKLR